MTKEFIDAGDVARLIGLPDRGCFLRRRDTLENHHGFPQPLPFGSRTLIWRRNQVMAWLDEQSQPVATDRSQFQPRVVA